MRIVQVFLGRLPKKRGEGCGEAGVRDLSKRQRGFAMRVARRS